MLLPRSVVPYVCLTFSAVREVRCVSRVTSVCVCQMCASTPQWFISCLNELYSRSRSSRWKCISRCEDNKAAHTGCPWGLIATHSSTQAVFLCCLVKRQIKWLRFHSFFLESAVCCPFLSAVANSFRPALFHRIQHWFLGITNVFSFLLLKCFKSRLRDCFWQFAKRHTS